MMCVISVSWKCKNIDLRSSVEMTSCRRLLLLKSGYIPGYGLLCNYLINYCCHSLLEHIYTKVKSLGS